MKNNCGIYIIRNIMNNKFYVGSTVDLHSRKLKHFRLLVQNKHHSPKLQRAVNKYGINNFIFEIILFTKRNQNKILEQEILDIIKPEYNVCKNAIHPMQGRHHSKSTKIIMSEQKKKPVEDSLGNIFQSLAEAADFHGIKYTTISEILAKRRLATRKTYVQFKLLGEEREWISIDILKSRYKGEFNGRSKLKEKDIKKIINLRKKGVKPKILAAEFNCSLTTIYRICSGRGWKCVHSN